MPVENSQSTHRGRTFAELVRSDFDRIYENRPVTAAPGGRILRVLRAIANPQIQAAFLIRSLNASPNSVRPLLRNVLFYVFSIDIGRRVVIGPRLLLPHPHGIAIANDVEIGHSANLHQNVAIGEHRGIIPVIGDNVTMYPGSVIAGACVGDRCTIGAVSYVGADLPDDTVFRGRQTDSSSASRTAPGRTAE